MFISSHGKVPTHMGPLEIATLSHWTPVSPITVIKFCLWEMMENEQKGWAMETSSFWNMLFLEY
jgi:hypothetical protein